MKAWRVYFYLGGNRRDNVIQEWLRDERISPAQIAMFQDKIDALEAGGPDMVPGFITPTPVARDLYKMKIKGNKGMKQLRPMCCRGPFGPQEFTILAGAIEKDGALLPHDFKERAQANLLELRKDPSRRTHGRLKPKPNPTEQRIHVAPKPEN